VTYLGFLGTTGSDFIDYFITDKVVTPPHHAIYYTESFVYLPNCYQVNSLPRQGKSRNGLVRSDVELPEDRFVFCSFNQPYKIEPVIFDVWMKIMRQVKDSVLWLSWKNKTAERNLKKEAKARGIEKERLIFAKTLPLEAHLQRLELADLMLDTRVYNGGATTSNALLAGIPVVTIEGDQFVSRMSSSSLKAVGLSELVVTDLESYESLAVDLANDVGRLKHLREKLRKNYLTSSLFDTNRFARNLEKGFMAVWQRYVNGEEPGLIEVSER
jgi:predicted O-linked N-acetylglucosamine transferase (SPINDLY family)